MIIEFLKQRLGVWRNTSVSYDDPLPVDHAGPNHTVVGESETNLVLGAGGGAAEDTITRVTFRPHGLNPGSVSVKDGASGTSITLFTGGTASVSTLHNWSVDYGFKSVDGGWYVTTGADIEVIVFGKQT